MAKKQTNKPTQNPVAANKEGALRSEKVTAAARNTNIPSIFYDFKLQAIVVALLAILFYANTYYNEYAIDDSMVIVENEYVQQGFKGIPDIMTRDAYESFFKHSNTSDQVQGGRYRPLSIAMFAIEQQFLGTRPTDADTTAQNGSSAGATDAHEKLMHDMHIRHALNVFWFALSMVVLLYFLRYIVFKSNPVMAFIAAIIFTIHPIHTEVVANVKSRDEIMSLLLICLTFIFAFKYREQKKIWLAAAGLVSYFLAFLAKEYAITLVVLLPLAFYLFGAYSIRKSMVATLPYLAVVIVYVFMRLAIMGPSHNGSEAANHDIQIDPYAYATPNERVATKIATTLSYLRLLVFPSPLSADYSYNAIPYKTFANPQVWLSIVIQLALLCGFFLFLKKRRELSFAIAFYFANLLLVCNLVFEIGGTMGERLIYHSSVGFAIAVGYLLYKGMELIKPPATGRLALAGVMALLIVLCGFKTISRNADWKNNQTLFFQDIKVVPDAILANASVASSLTDIAAAEKDEKTKKADLDRAIGMYDKAIAMDSIYVTAYINKAVAFNILNQPDSCIYTLDKVRKIAPTRPELPGMYNHMASLYFNAKDYSRAAALYKTSIDLSPNYVAAYANIAACYGSVGKFDSTIYYARKAIAIDPTFKSAYQILASTYGTVGNLDSANKYNLIAQKK